MKVAIAGGALQGLEMAYLARKAGFETLLLDRRSDAPARGICDRFVATDFTDREALERILDSADVVLPAVEDADALQSLVEWCEGKGTPLAFDAGAYRISSSKTASNSLFRRLGIPAPAPWPACAFPVLVKPDGRSGSRGVEVFSNGKTLERRFGRLPPAHWVLQEYLSGPLHSIEVIGRPGSYTPLQTTSLEVDRDHGCKRVMAPSPLPSNLTGQFENVAVTLAEALDLTGIMDVEAILHEGQLKVLEMDARFPSQTPIAVYLSTGINMLQRLVRVFCTGDGISPDPLPAEPAGGSVLEHIRVGEGHLSVCGETAMVDHGPLHLEADFFGADEALTSWGSDKSEWVATLMIKGPDLESALERRGRVIGEIRNQLGLDGYSDESPEVRVRSVP